MDKLGYRKVERFEPTFGQWLKERGWSDANLDLYYLRNVGPNAQHRRQTNKAAMRRFKKSERHLMKEEKHQRRLYNAAISAGEVQKKIEYKPLDMDNPADAAYYRAQKKRQARREKHEQE